MNDWVASGFGRKDFAKIFRLKAEATRSLFVQKRRKMTPWLQEAAREDK